MNTSFALRFSLDSSLGRLARYLRLLGHDAAWAKGDSLECALLRARAERRILLTRSTDTIGPDFAWPMAGGMVVQSGERTMQLAEVGSRWPLFSQATPFSRCADCNERLLPVDPADVEGRVPAFVAATQASFQTCPLCARIFWNGTHAEQLLLLFEDAASLCSQVLAFGTIKRNAGSETSDPALPNG